jgi:hypothetical protein
MKTHIMIDIETLGTNPDCVILSVGAVKFDPFGTTVPQHKTLWRPNIDQQLEAGRTVDEGTLEWWSKQAADIRENAFSTDDRIDLDDFFKSLNRYMTGADKIWCQGPQFDMVIIEDLYRQFDHHRNWAYWQVSDCRTIFNMMPVDPRKAIQQNLHRADEDAYWQAVCVQRTFKHFGVQPR